MFIIWCIFIIIFLYAHMHFRKQSRLIDKMFPGPLRLPIIGTITLKAVSPEGTYKYFLEKSKTYNYKAYRIWIMQNPYIMIPDFKLAKVILSKLKFTDKSDTYDAFLPWFGRNQFVGNGEEWLRYRKQDVHAFRHREIVQFLQPASKNGNILCEKLSRYDGKSAFDITEYISKYSFDNICEYILGTQLHAQTERVCPYTKALKNMGKIVFFKIAFPILRVDWVFSMTPLSRLQKKSVKILRDFSDRLIREKRSQITNRKALNETDLGEDETTVFLDHLLKNDTLLDEEIQTEIEFMIFAGHDTVTASLNFILYSLAEHQDVQEKVYEELRNIFGDSTSNLNINQLNSMKYTEQVIRESLRYYTAVPFLGRYIKEDLYIDEKQFIPKGTNVLITTASIHRDPTNWPDPDTFDPDRFSYESSQQRDPYAFLAFSAGPRNCLGNHVAMIEMKITVAEILTKYHLSLSDNPQHKIRPAYNLMLTSANGFYLKIKSRNNIQ